MTNITHVAKTSGNILNQFLMGLLKLALGVFAVALLMIFTLMWIAMSLL